MRCLILLALFPMMVLADHLPDNLIAQGKRESQLCAIEVNRTRVDELMKSFGKPAVYKKYPKTKDQAEIAWDKHGTWIRTYINVEQIAYAVAVSGTPNEMAITGQGLRLGQTMDDAIRIYGKRYSRRQTEVLFQWKDGTELRISFEKDRINKLMLVAPVE